MEFILMYVIAAVILILDIVISYNISKSIDLRKLFKGGLNRLNEQYQKRKLLGIVQKYTRAVSIKQSFIDRLQFRYIDKLNIRSKLPDFLASFLNIFTLFLVNIILFVVSFPAVYKILLSLPSAIIISLFITLLPYFLLDLAARYNSEKVRRKMADFISILNRWIDVKSDIFYAFRKAVGFNLGKDEKSNAWVVEPLRTYIWDMLIQIEMGVDPFDALDNIDRKVDNLEFSDFILNIKQTIKSRGNMKVLLSNMEDQYFKLEEEYNRRKLTTLKDRVIIFISMLMTLGVAFYILKFNVRVSQFYTATLPGQLLLALFSLMFLGGLILSLSISTYKH